MNNGNEEEQKGVECDWSHTQKLCRRTKLNNPSN